MKRSQALLLCLFAWHSTAPAALLTRLHEQAKEQSPTWLAAEAAYESVLAARPVARSGLMPQLQVLAGYGRTRDETTASSSRFFEDRTLYGNSSSATVFLDQPLFDMTAWSNWDQYQQREARAALDLRQAQQNLILEVASRYLAWLEAGVALDFTQSHLAALQESFKQISNRERLGLATRSDRLQVQAVRDSADADVLSAAANLRAKRESLRELLGTVPENPVPLIEQIPLADPEPADPEKWVEQALQSNPEVAAAVILQDVARKELSERKVQRLPTVALQGRYGYNNTDDFQLGREWNDSRIELKLKVPLYSGGAIGGNINVAARVAEQREQELLAARRAAENTARNAYDGVVTGAMRVRVARRALQSSEEAESAIVGSFDSGLATLADTLDASQQVRRALRDLTSVRHVYLMSRLRLAASVGSLGPDHLAMIDRLLVDQQ